MSARQQNTALVAVLVVALVLIAFFLRRDTATEGSGARIFPTRSTTAAPTGSASATASASASTSASPSPTAAPITKVVVLGDSIAAGTGASSEAKRWSSLLAAANGWTETNLAHPQTGYLRTGSQAPCTAKTCPNFADSVSAAVAAAPDLVLVTGGANDLGLDAAAASASVTKTLGDLRAGLPNARIVVLNPWWDMRAVNPKLAPYAEVIKTATAAANATYADTGQPLSGHVDLVTSDGLNANDAGHAALATAVTGALKLAGLPVK